MFTESQQAAIKVFYANGNLMQADQYSTSLLTTGIKIMLVDNKTVTDELYIAIKGDINGDGVVNTVDSSLLKQYIRGVAGISDVYLVAADMNNDGIVNVTDRSLFVTW